MSSSSNLYAERVFAEQPIALWALDDKVDFLSILPSNYTSSSSWTKSSDVSNLDIYFDSPDFSPIPSSPRIDIQAASSETGQKVARISIPIGNLNTLNSQMGTFSAGTYLYSKNELISRVDFGIQYTDPQTGLEVERPEYTESVFEFKSNVWGMLSKTFPVPSTSGTFSLFIEITYEAPPEGVEPAYEFYLNGLSLGQNSEDFHVNSIGIKPVSLPVTIATDVEYGIRADAYGLQSLPAYYVADESRLYAKNSGMPLVYGASNVTRLYPNNDKPSIIFPGLGFLNQSGRYKDYTVEFWLRAPHTSTIPKRIFGSIASQNGLYVHGSFITIKIGKSIISHSVGEWNRPMLVSFILSSSSAALIINGEEVASLEISDATTYPSKNDLEGRDQDWVGFYAYESVFEIDSFAIYPYRVPEAIAKRRFVYGQGVDFPQNINTAYNGSAFFIDYPMAKYSNNYNYPDLARWRQGNYENLIVSPSAISTPSHRLPEVVLSNNLTTDTWLDYCNSLTPDSEPYLTFNYEDSENPSYMLLPPIESVTQNWGGIFGVFQLEEDTEDEQILFWIENEQTGNYFSISTIGGVVNYKLFFNSVLTTLESIDAESLQNKFSVGLDLKALVSSFGRSASLFFADSGKLKIYVGGNKDLQKTFYGKIYKAAIVSSNDLVKIRQLFNASGFANLLSDVFELYFDELEEQIPFTRNGGEYDDTLGNWPVPQGVYGGGTWEELGAGVSFENHISTYTLIPSRIAGDLLLDVAASSYWEDYVPLKYFAKYVDDGFGDRIYSLDFLQLNLGYPRPLSPGTESYPVRTYVTFKFLASGSYSSDAFFLYREPVPANGVLTPGSAWERTKYEVTDGTLIYLPPNANYDQLSIGVHVEIVSDGVRKSPVAIKTLQLASQSYAISGPNPINTRFGLPIFPYVRNGIYFDYREKNPVEIYKGSSPYLYLTDSSGVRLRGDYADNRGISMPINTNLSELFAVGAIQANIKKIGGTFSNTPEKILEIDSKNAKINLYAVAANASGTRARVYAKNVAGFELRDDPRFSALGVPQLEGIAFYLNGQAVKEIFLDVNEWSAISLQFAEPLILNSYVGAIRQTGSMLFNTPVIYPLSSSQTIANLISRLWQDLPSIGIDYWSDLLSTVPALSWANVLYIPSEKNYTIDPIQRYREFIGTSRVSVTDNGVVLLKNYQYSVYQNITWQSNILSAV
jgi:hypothetical protein